MLLSEIANQNITIGDLCGPVELVLHRDNDDYGNGIRFERWWKYYQDNYEREYRIDGPRFKNKEQARKYWEENYG